MGCHPLNRTFRLMQNRPVYLHNLPCSAVHIMRDLKEKHYSNICFKDMALKWQKCKCCPRWVLLSPAEIFWRLNGEKHCLICMQCWSNLWSTQEAGNSFSQSGSREVPPSTLSWLSRQSGPLCRLPCPFNSLMGSDPTGPPSKSNTPHGGNATANREQCLDMSHRIANIISYNIISDNIIVWIQ